jgi:hypothetical protein
MQYTNEAISIIARLPPPLHVAKQLRKEMRHDGGIPGGVVDCTQCKRQDRVLRDVAMADAAPLQQQFFIFELGPRPPEYFFRHETVWPLHLQKRSQLANGIRSVSVRPHNHVRAAVPKPLVGAVLLQGWAIKSERHVPFGAFAKISLECAVAPFQHVVEMGRWGMPQLRVDHSKRSKLNDEKDQNSVPHCNHKSFRVTMQLL